jgi:hypothetical protein
MNSPTLSQQNFNFTSIRLHIAQQGIVKFLKNTETIMYTNEDRKAFLKATLINTGEPLKFVNRILFSTLGKEATIYRNSGSTVYAKG